MTNLTSEELRCNCGSLACNACREQLQRSFKRRALVILERYPNPRFLTIIPRDGIVGFEVLHDFNLDEFKNRNRKRLARCLADDCVVMGSVDVCLNVFGNKVEGWSFHLHAVMSRPLNHREIRKLKALFPTNRQLGIFKPVVQKPIARTELRSTAQYVCKSFYTRRSVYTANPKSGRNRYRSSCAQALSVKEDAMLNAALERYRVSDPLIFIGLKRQRSSDPTELRLVRTRR